LKLTSKREGDKMEIAGKIFCFTGKFEYIDPETKKNITRKKLESEIISKGGVIKSSVTSDLDYIIVGGLGSTAYSEGTKGKKIIKAENQVNTKIINEKEFIDYLGK
jgi:NAD-dependent DNA ligase